MKKLIFLVALTIIIVSCKKDSLISDNELKSTPNNMASVTEIDTINATGVFPMYRGQDANGGDVFYVITESNDVDKAIELGLNWSPKLIHAMGTVAVQTATVVTGGAKNPHDFPILKFAGNVDFSPVNKLVPGPDLFPLDPASEPGSVGDAAYSPLVTFDGKILYDAAHIANSTGVHDKVISMDKVNMTVKIQLTKGFYEGFSILYTSTETSDNDLAALEDNTFAPNMNAAPNPGDDKSFRSAREAIIPVINGPMGVDNPNRQGLRSAVAGEGDPLNIFQEQAGCQDASDPSAFCDAAAYSPFWDATPVMWTDSAIAAGMQTRVKTDKHEIIAPINIIELYADGFLLPGGMGVRNASLGGINVAGPAGGPGIIINCPIVFVPDDAR
ncbi:MAG: hypothetical protein H0W62_01645 [Chitinophagales bacterium]|nr:hypothetical protein [Chitinophagales bacterium]